MPSPNYRMYSVEQLADALEHIDKNKFPERVDTIKKYLKNPGPRGHSHRDKRITISKETNAALSWLSVEIVLWFVLAGLGALAYAID